jgi:hypothetical protein
MNQVMHVSAFIRKAAPSHAARRHVLRRAKRTSDSSSSGIHPAKR